MPRGWPTGYHGIMTRGPGEKPKLEYRNEVARLDDALVRKALALTRDVSLADDPKAQAYRARYRRAPASQPPRVIQCDTLAGDTWWHGHRLGEHARAWTRLLSDGDATYCTTQQEDNATYNALARAAAAGRVDLRRLAVLRTASNFDRPYPGQSAHASLIASTSGTSAASSLRPPTSSGSAARWSRHRARWVAGRRRLPRCAEGNDEQALEGRASSCQGGCGACGRSP